MHIKLNDEHLHKNNEKKTRKYAKDTSSFKFHTRKILY